MVRIESPAIVSSIVVTLSALTACSRSEAPPPNLWIWQFVEMPSKDGEWFEELESVLSLLDETETVSLSTRPEFCKALASSGDASSNSANLEYSELVGERFYDRYEYRGRRIKTSSLIALVEAATDLSRQLVNTGELESAASIADSLLLLGYQMSRNGENNVVAIVRLHVWSAALDCILATQQGADPRIRAQIDGAKELIRVELAQIRERKSGRLYYPF